MEKFSDSLSERISVAETLVKCLLENRTEIGSRQRNLDSVRESVVGRRMEIECVSKSLKRRLHDLEKREKEFDASKEGKQRKMASEEDELSLKRQKLAQAGVRRIHRQARKKLKKIESEKLDLKAAQESVAERERKVSTIIGTLDERISAVEEREATFNLFLEGKMREMELKEEQLHLKWEEFVDQVNLADAKFRKQENLKNAVMEKIELAEKKLETMRADMDERFMEIEFREIVAWETVASSVKEADLIRESLEKQAVEFEKMKSEFNSFQEDKMRELDSKERLLNGMSEDLVMNAKLWNEQLINRERSVNQLLRRVHLAKDNVEGLKDVVAERFKEIEFRENVAWESVASSVKEDDSIRVSMEKQAVEFEKMKSEFNSFQEDKMRELDSKEKLLNGMSEELVKNAKLRNGQLISREWSANQLLRRLHLAKDNVEGLKDVVDKRFKKVTLMEIEVNSLRDWVEKRMDEIDPKAKELEEKEERINIKEDSVMHKENELKEKEKELDLKETRLWAWQQDLEVKQEEVDSAQQLNEQQLQKLDTKEKSLNSVRQCINNCFKEHLDIKRKLKLEKDLVEKTAKFLGLTEESLEHALRELEFREKQMRDHVEEHELEQQRSIEPDESVDLKFTVRMDGRNLQMFLNDPEKDLESMGDEIFKVLHLSLDPAKLVLDALEGFYPPHLRKQDTTFNVRRTCIALLQHLIRMSKKIKPRVREVAIELATAWRSKMRATVQYPKSLEVLGFLLLLAAYNLASCFDKDEISSLLKMVAQHRETAELHRNLGFPEISAGERRNTE